MKTLLSALLMIAFCFAASAQKSKSYDTDAISAGIDVVNISWTDSGFTWDNDNPKGSFSIDVVNTGTKTITEVSWDFILVDKVRDHEYDHFKFKTGDKPIKPGQKKRLTKRIQFSTIPDYISAQARIMRVKYDDGSEWARPEKGR